MKQELLEGSLKLASHLVNLVLGSASRAWVELRVRIRGRVRGTVRVMFRVRS